jgi:6-phosphogluconolactonase
MYKKSGILILFLCCVFLTELRAQHTYVFIGSYNYDKTKEGIYVYELDTSTGNLSKISSLNNSLNPSFLTLSEDGLFVFACTDTRVPKDGSVSSFKFDATAKSLSFISRQKTGGENPVYLSLHKSGKWLANANYNDGSAAVYPVDKDGIIAPAVQFIRYTDSSLHKTKQSSAHVHATVFSPDGNAVFLPDLGADKIRCYPFKSNNKLPLDTARYTSLPTIPGSGPRHLCFHPNGKYAYCTEEISGTISVYRYTHKKLKKIQRIAAHRQTDTGTHNSADIHCSPDGRFLYTSNRGDENNIAIFTIARNGKLKSIAYQTVYGKTPRNFAIDESGKFLIVANQDSGNLVVFKRNSGSGLLEKTETEIRLENPTCVQIKTYGK